MDNAKLIAELLRELDKILNHQAIYGGLPAVQPSLLKDIRAALSAQSEPESKVLFCPGCGCGEGEYHATNCPVLASENEAMAVDRSKLRHCPKCWTYGHDHRKDCPYVGQGMEHHVAPTP